MTYKTRDLTGKKFGLLTALRPTGERRRGYVVWECRCDCGTEGVRRSVKHLVGKGYGPRVKSCGCAKNKDSYVIGLSGTGHTVLSGVKNDKYSGRYLCRCACGREYVTNHGRAKDTDIRCRVCRRNARLPDWARRPTTDPRAALVREMMRGNKTVAEMSVALGGVSATRVYQIGVRDRAPQPRGRSKDDGQEN